MGDLLLSVLVTPVVEQVIKDVKSLIQQKYKLLKGVEKDMEKLSSRLSSITAGLQDAENKQTESSSVKDWLGKLKEVAYDSEDLLETLATEAFLWERKQKVRLIKNPFSASQIGYKLNGARAIKDILERLDDIEKEKAIFNLDVNVVSPSAALQNRITSHVVHESDIVGRENDKNNLINMLLSEKSEGDSHISVIPVIGMGGLGKTTLAQLVYNDDRVENHFKVMMWVCVTDNYDHKRIFKDMIVSHSKMKYDVDSFSEIQLESRLLDILEGNRLLLVLDDVWNDSLEDWKKIERLLKRGGKGSKVLVTSRGASVSEVMRTEPPYLLDYMPENECWSLFEKIVFHRGSLVSSGRRDLEHIGKQIVEKCKGLPLAVRAMGGLLRGNNDVEKWRRILQHDIWEVEENSIRTGKPVIIPALRLSYDHLPSDLKQCFAYCCLFPKAHVFHKAELIKLWKAASLIRPRPAYKLDDIASDYFDEMLSRSLFELSKVGNILTYRMHDLIHDLAISVSNPYFYQIRDNDLSGMPEKVRHVALFNKNAQQQQHIVEELGRFRKLRTLISPVEYSRDFGLALDKLFHLCKCLRTLDLSSSMITKLPESVGELKLLHYLDLSKTEIRRLPDSLCKLSNLQTLKLLGCLWLFELPKSFGNLISLEHLELDDMFWQKSLALPSNIGSLKNLQNLHVFRIGDKRGYGIDELKDMLLLKGSLHISRLENARKTGEPYIKDKESLVKVIYEWSNRDGSPEVEAEDREMIEDLEPHPNVEEIEILHYLGDRIPSWLGSSVLQNITTLSLKHCKSCKILSFGELPNLQNIRLKGLAELEKWPEAQYNKLCRLKISSCPKLQQVPSVFLNLNVMKIKKCESLEVLPLTPSLRFLILIDNLHLKEFNEQNVRLVFSNDQGERRDSVFPSFLNLLEMKIVNCSMLSKLPDIFAPQKLVISGCPLITALPASEFARRLQHLAIDTCDDGQLVSVIPHSSSLYSLVVSNVQQISSLPKLPHLPGLKAMYIHECNELVSLSDDQESFQSLNGLQLLSIQGCPKLDTFQENLLPSSLTCLIIASCPSLKSLGPGDMLKKLASLKDLYIEDCPELESLPEDGLPTSIQHLRIEGCPLLMSRCKESGPDWPKIKEIPDLDLDF